MKLARDAIAVSTTDPASVARFGQARTLHLSDGGGLTQFGVHHQTLEPGARSSDRHWHDKEDEFLYMLDGHATVEDDDGVHDLGPGDAAGWRHGDPNAHCVVNRSDRPCSYLIAGTRVARDLCHYPDTGRTQVNGDTAWQILDAAGTVLREGQLPPALLNLPPVWGTPYDGTPSARILWAKGRDWTAHGDTAHPVLGRGLGPFRAATLGEAAGLSQFGVHLEALPPGSRSSFRHWHAAEDEMVYVTHGTLTLIENDEQPMVAGDTACWPAGRPVGHCLENRGSHAATYLVFGTRLAVDTIHYPDHDLITHKDGPARRYAHGDGTAYERTAP